MCSGLFRKYCSLCPSSTNSDALYLRPLQKKRDNVWYSQLPIGRHKLAGVVAKLCSDAGLTGYRTNHSLRATAASRLYQANVDEQLICQVTGHRSLAVRNYKRTSSYQKKGLCKIIQDKLQDLLMFMTGTNQIPPLGFPKAIVIDFYSYAENERPGFGRLPWVSTCDLSIYLPRGISDSNVFENIFDEAIASAKGFGKV